MVEPIKIKEAPSQHQPFFNDAEELIDKYTSAEVGKKDGFIKTPAEANSAFELCLRTQQSCNGLKKFMESHQYKLVPAETIARFRSEIDNTNVVQMLLSAGSEASEARVFSLAWTAFDKTLRKTRSDKKEPYSKANTFCDIASAMHDAGVKKFVIRKRLIEAFDEALKVQYRYNALDAYRGAFKTYILCKVGQVRAKADLNKKEVYEPFKMALGTALNSEDPLDALKIVVGMLTDSELTDEALIAVRTAKIVREGKELKIDHHKIKLMGIIALKRHEAGAKKDEVIKIFRNAAKIARTSYEDIGRRWKAMAPLRNYYFSAAGLEQKEKDELLKEAGLK